MDKNLRDDMLRPLVDSIIGETQGWRAKSQMVNRIGWTIGLYIIALAIVGLFDVVNAFTLSKAYHVSFKEKRRGLDGSWVL